MKPGTLAAMESHSWTLASSSPRPSTMQLTWSRPSRRAAATIFTQSSRAVEAFDLPDVGLDAGVLQLFDCPDHQAGAKLEVVFFLVATDAVELRFFGRDEQLEHEQAAALGVQVVGEPLEAGGLFAVERLVAFGIVADEDFAEGGLNLFDVGGEVVAVFEVEFVLAALLGGAGGGETLGGGVAKDGDAELLVDEDAGLGFGDAGGDRLLESRRR